MDRIAVISRAFRALKRLLLRLVAQAWDAFRGALRYLFWPALGVQFGAHVDLQWYHSWRPLVPRELLVATLELCRSVDGCRG